MLSGMLGGLLFLILMLVIHSIPLLLCVMLCATIIGVIKTKLICIELKVPIIIIILLILFIIYLGITSHETPNSLYIKMSEFHDNQSLVGLSEEEVIELLGEPKYEGENKKTNKKTYTYYAGTVRKEWFFGKYYTTDYYELNIYFDLDEKVERTYIKLNNS